MNKMETRRDLLEVELAILQTENRSLKEIKRLEQELAAMQAQNRPRRCLAPELELAALRAENCLLKKIRQLEEGLVTIQAGKRRLEEGKRREPMMMETAKANPRRAGRRQEKLSSAQLGRYLAGSQHAFEPRTAKCVLTEHAVQSVRQGEDVFAAAMQYVEAGEAVLMHFAGDEYTVVCGDAKRAIQVCDIAFWQSVFQASIETPEQFWACPVLYLDEARLILVANSNAIDEMEAIQDLLEQFELIAAFQRRS